jgi:hypothetical protein
MDPTLAENDLSDVCTLDLPQSHGKRLLPNGKRSANDNSKFAKKKTKVQMFTLSHGVIRFNPGSTSEEKMSIRQQHREMEESGLKRDIAKIIPDTWLFFNQQLFGKPIQLYGSQALKLCQLLPAAYAAWHNEDTTYYEIVGQTKTQFTTLEVNIFKEKMNVTLKKCFKPDDKADDPNQDWIPSGHFVNFDPDEDDPNEMMDFILMSSS